LSRWPIGETAGDLLAQIAADAPIFVGSVADLGAVGIDPAARCSNRGADGKPSRRAAYDRRAAIAVATIPATIRVAAAIAPAIAATTIRVAPASAATITPASAATIIDFIDLCGGEVRRE
jgi:hypothetical protein